MTTLRKAAQQALEALESCWEKGLTRKNWKQTEEAITALRTALAESEPDDEHCPHCNGEGCVACDARKLEGV